MKSDRGAALVAVMLAMTLLLAVGGALALTASAETIVAANFAWLYEARYAAEGALDRALADIAVVDDWNLLAAGAVTSPFADGPSFGVRIVAGRTIDLAGVVNIANCGKPTSCSAAEITGNATGQRPWGANNPVWHLFAYGRFAALFPDGAGGSACYVVVLVGDDPAEIDGVPSIDGATPCDAAQRPPACNPGSGAIAVRAEAFGPAGVHQIVEAVVARPAVRGQPVRTRAEWTRDVR